MNVKTARRTNSLWSKLFERPARYIHHRNGAKPTPVYFRRPEKLQKRLIQQALYQKKIESHSWRRVADRIRGGAPRR